jgi:hypothetical protein
MTIYFCTILRSPSPTTIDLHARSPDPARIHDCLNADRTFRFPAAGHPSAAGTRTPQRRPGAPLPLRSVSGHQYLPHPERELSAAAEQPGRTAEQNGHARAHSPTRPLRSRTPANGTPSGRRNRTTTRRPTAPVRFPPRHPRPRPGLPTPAAHPNGTTCVVGSKDAVRNAVAHSGRPPRH